MKVMAMSKDFFACGWNIFDLIIVSASLLDLIFELVDGLSVLRGLRLVSLVFLIKYHEKYHHGNYPMKCELYVFVHSYEC